MQLFFILGAVQTLPVWILVDSGSVSNLIDESVYNRYPFKPPIRDPGDVRVIGGNGESLDLKGFVVLPVALGSNLNWHEFGVVPNLLLEVLINSDVLGPHLCMLLYLTNKKRLQFKIQVCPRCLQYRTDPEVGSQKQLRFVDRSLKRKRIRLRAGYNFLATFPKAVCDDSDSEQLNEASEGQALSVGTEGHELHQTDDPSHTSSIAPITIMPLAQSETNKKSGKITQKEPDQSGKLQRVLSDLKIAVYPIPDELRKRLIEVVRENLDAFAASPTDLGRNSAVIHTIITGEECFFRHKLRAIPFARQAYLEQEVKRLMSVGAISPADPGAYPYASRTVVTP